MYGQLDSHAQLHIWQGDIISEFPFPSLSGDSLSLMPSINTDVKDFTDIKDMPAKGILLAPIEKTNIIVLSQTCDVENRPFSIVAVVKPISKLVEEGVVKSTQLDTIKSRRLNYLFYLPSYLEVLPESLALLQAPQYISSDLLKTSLPNRLVSLSDWGRHHLTWQMTNFLARPILDKYSKL